ncbi:MAG: hypothetical protein OEZ58_19425 [Gammaproteobacteria bacterium]|nr:hypothetical protein [Gammaproteobacteria bacterium]
MNSETAGLADETVITHKMKHVILLIIVMLVSGCEQKKTIAVTPEQAVYETFFLKSVGDMHSKYHLVDSTEYIWFAENSIEQFQWERALKSLGNISMELVNELYRRNDQSYPLNWQPLITTVTLLSKEYLGKNNQSSDLCFEKGSGNVNIFDKIGRQFRAYYSISRVAFSEDSKIALLKYSYLCAPMSGATEAFVSFTFTEGEWKLLGGYRLWIS